MERKKEVRSSWLVRTSWSIFREWEGRLYFEVFLIFYRKVGWLRFGLLQGTHCIVSTGSPSSGLGIKHRFFVRFLILRGIFWCSFRIFLNRLDQLGTGSTGSSRQPCFINTLYCFGRFSLIQARNWAPFFFFWIPYSSRNLLVKVQNFSQSVELVGNQFNRFC